jgi:hypothetical protein
MTLQTFEEQHPKHIEETRLLTRYLFGEVVTITSSIFHSFAYR